MTSSPGIPRVASRPSANPHPSTRQPAVGSPRSPVSRLAPTLVTAALAVAPLAAQRTPLTDHFVNFESAHVHPLEMTPNGQTLLAVNSADARLEVFDLSTGTPVPTGSIQVGLDPVTVRAVDDDTAWVCNHISDSISIVDLSSLTVQMTIPTGDEPSDVVFTPAMTVEEEELPPRAWVTLSQPDTVEVYDLNNLTQPPTRIALLGQDPRSMVLAPDGLIYVGIFTSANDTTVLNGSDTRWAKDAITGNAANLPNPPPNTASGFVPGKASGNPAEPKVSHIVRKNFSNQWRDDANNDWTTEITGGAHGRAQDWDMYDHDIAVIDPATSTVVGYVKRAMNVVANVAVRYYNNQDDFVISAVGMESTNEIRFEPNLNGKFVRAHLAGAFPWTSGTGSPPTTTALGPFELNGHLANGGSIPSGQPYGVYASGNLPQNVRDTAIGDPRYHIWDATGDVGFVSGMGSNNVIIIDPAGNRLTGTQPIEVGEGPTGLVLDGPRGVLYVLNRFSNSLTVANLTGALTEIPFHDPTPLAAKGGRKHLFDTHKSSGLGQAACASCHIDGDLDGLGWDLGDPSGQVRAVHGLNIDRVGQKVASAAGPPNEDTTQRFHPMKGPMVTQSLRDIIGKEPFHWRGDKKGLEEFNGAFTHLQNDDVTLSAAEMGQFEDYLETLWYPPNPLRNHKNEFEASTVLDGSHPALPGIVFRDHNNLDVNGDPSVLPPGNGTLGAGIGATGASYAALCVNCHTATTGTGPDMVFTGSWQQLMAGTYGEAHTALITTDGTSQVPMKIPGLRNMHERTGFDMTAARSKAGFGFLHDGHIDTISRFLKPFTFPANSTTPLTLQETANITAFLLQFASNRTYGQPTNIEAFAPGPPAQNAHPAVGMQLTVASYPMTTPDAARYQDLLDALSFDATNVANGYDVRQIGLIVKQNQPGGGQQGFLYVGPDYLDDNNNVVTVNTLLNSIGAGTEATFTIVPTKSERRLAIDRDADGWLDGEETATFSTNAASARSIPIGAGTPCTGIALPPAMTGVTSTAVGIYGNGISWTIPAGSNHTGVAIERMLANSPQWETVAEIPSATATTYTDGTVTLTTQYFYRVRSYNCAGEAVSPTATHTTYVVPSNVTPVHLHSIELNWATETINGQLHWFAYGTFHVVDDEDRAMKGVRVTAQITGQSGVKTGATWGLDPVIVAGAAFSTQTNGEGQAFFRSTSMLIPAPVPPATTVSASWTFQVSNIDTAPGGPMVTYQSGANKVATSASVTATQ